MSPSTWRKWKNLTANERHITQTALWSSLWVAVQLRLRGYKPTRENVERLALGTPHDIASLDEISRVTHSVLRRVPWSPNCLERSLVLMRVIRHLHFQDKPVLRLGVRRGENALEFHAWVEAGDHVVGDRSDIAQTFTPFGGEELPPEATFV